MSSELKKEIKNKHISVDGAFMTLELKERIFGIYCSISSDIMNAGHCIVSSNNISNLINCSLYNVRKAIKELVNDSQICSCSYPSRNDRSKVQERNTWR